ncbi:hypothetical protein GOP47_0016792 [Adiantum capillus-veneris]|uniref:Uncharacterized protein n=1 Tax=Adiantum capillus-veneris TaxID=13818 RepID=A0A9D4UIQ7_ADICA|nr:hypothetical protein GOP47_0016792 [Adiantum capillus-veneris]
MGKKMHLHCIFPGEPFPNVQFKPRRSIRDRHLFQVECKVAGAGFINPDLRDKRLLIGAKYESLTEACLASNFTIRLMREVRAEVKARLAKEGGQKELKENDHAYIRVPHIKHADIDPFDWYKLYLSCNKRDQHEKVANDYDNSVRTEIHNLLRDNAGHLNANKQFAAWANRYKDAIINFTERNDKMNSNLPRKKAKAKYVPNYVDPDHWRNKINDYLAKAPFNVYDTMGKPERKILNEGKPSFVFAPRITAVGAGPNMMPLVYHLSFHGSELGSPCFFNKNFTLFSRSVKVLDMSKARDRPKWQESFSFTDQIRKLPRLHISTYRNHNYYGGAFQEDFVKDEGLKVLPWANTQPDEHTFPHDPPIQHAIVNDDFERIFMQDVRQPCQSRNENDIICGGEGDDNQGGGHLDDDDADMYASSQEEEEEEEEEEEGDGDDDVAMHYAKSLEGQLEVESEVIEHTSG